jgi:hypothetical protein
MAAGLGFKDFTTGEVLTAADVDGYLMQGIWVFATTAARDAAVTAPAEGNFAFTKDTNSLWYYDGAAWVASGAAGDIEGVTAGIGISGGGTSGTVTVTNSMATAIDAKGDLVAGTGADTFSRLAVGANDTILTADSTAATGMKWAAPAAAGGMTLITEVVASSQSQIDITGISGSYKQLYLIYSGITHSTTGSQFNFLLNNDSASNYKHNRRLGTDSAFATTNRSNPDINSLNSFGENVTSASLQESVQGCFLIDNYASSTKYKSYNGEFGYYNNTSGVINYSSYNGVYASTSAVTQINIVRLSGSATLSNLTNTTIRLYGIS